MKNCVLMVIDLIRTRTNDYTTTNINNMREVMIKEKQFIHILSHQNHIKLIQMMFLLSLMI